MLTLLILLKPLLALQFTSPGASFNIGPLQLRWYGLLIASTVLIGASLSQALARRRKIKERKY